MGAPCEVLSVSREIVKPCTFDRRRVIASRRRRSSRQWRGSSREKVERTSSLCPRSLQLPSLFHLALIRPLNCLRYTSQCSSGQLIVVTQCGGSRVCAQVDASYFLGPRRRLSSRFSHFAREIGNLSRNSPCSGTTIYPTKCYGRLRRAYFATRYA